MLHSPSPREQVLTMKAVSSDCGTPLAGGPNQRSRWGGFHALGEGAVGKRNNERTIWKKVVVDGECWRWTGAVDRGGSGYGRVQWNGVERRPHRVFYEMFYGPIPEGLTIDHLCRNHMCVNPTHLEAVTSRVNTLRGNWPAAVNSRKSTCPRGHAYSGTNLYGRRICHECERIRHKRKRASLRAAVDALPESTRKEYGG